MRLIRAIWGWKRDTWAYLFASPARLGLVLSGLVVGFLVGVPVGDAGYDWTWRDPNFCGSCHVHDYANEAWSRSAHAGVTTCHDCHHVPLVHYPHNLKMMVVGRPQVPEDVGPAHVPSVLCGACHLESGADKELTGPMSEAFRAQVVKVDHSPLHRIHLEATSRDPGAYRGSGESAGVEPDRGHSMHAEGPIACLDCHGTEGNLATHRYTSSRDNCVSCHETIDQPHGRLAGLRCQECHLAGFVGHVPEVDE